MSDTVLPRDQVERLSGGYKRPSDQLRALHALGYYRARIGKVSREVVLERAHYDAVCAGQGAASNDDQHQPKVRPLRRAK